MKNLCSSVFTPIYDSDPAVGAVGGGLTSTDSKESNEKPPPAASSQNSGEEKTGDSQESNTVTSAQPSPTPPTDEKVKVLPTSAIARIKKDAAQKGGKDVLDSFEQEAKSLGFNSYEELRDAAVEVKNKKDAPIEPPEAGAPVVSEEVAELRGTLLEATDRIRRLETQLNDEKNKVVAKQAKIDDLIVQLELVSMAHNAGIRDTDYAVTLHNRKTQKMSKEELEGFSSEKFFSETLKESNPNLYGEYAVPATTSPATKEPSPADPKTQQQTDVGKHKVDALEMTEEQFKQHLAKQGLRDPSVSGASY